MTTMKWKIKNHKKFLPLMNNQVTGWISLLWRIY